MATTNTNISIRTRIRKASTSINPEFGPSVESILTFVSSSSSSSWKKKRSSSDGDSSIVITPLSILAGSTSPTVAATGGNAAWRSASPLRSQSAPRGRGGLSSSHRNRSFNNSGHPPVPTKDLVSSVGRRNSTNAAVGSINHGGGNTTNKEEEDDIDGMVDISLHDKQLPHNGMGNNGIIRMELETEERDDETREDKESNNNAPLLPPSQSQQQQQRQRRCSSPQFPIVQSGSGSSMPTAVGVGQQPHSTNNNTTSSSNNSIVSSTGSSSSNRPLSRSINARSRSINKNMRARSRSRGGGGGDSSLTCGGALSRGGSISLSGRRMRSAGAANAFNTSTVVCDDDLDHSLHNHQEEEMIMETMSVLLKDIISVRHETPNSSSMQTKSAAELQQVAVVSVASFTPPAASALALSSPPQQPLYRPGSKLSTTSTPLSPSIHTNCYRICMHTRMNGYLEFNFDNNSNSYEVVLAYLRCHLKDGMVPPDDVPVGNSGGGVGRSSAASRSLGEPVDLTRTKSLSNKVVVTSKTNGGGGGDDATVTSTSTVSTGDKQQQLPSSASFISQSNSSNPIERLQTKAINRQLQQENTPINSIKENVSGWLSSIIDCAGMSCCQDTTVTSEDNKSSVYNGIQGTPIRKQPSFQQRMTPRSKALKRNGIGGLSFEVETLTSNMS